MGLYFDQSATVFWRRRGGTSKPTRRNQRYSFVASPSSFFDPVRKIDPFLFCSRNSTITRFERKGRHGNRSLLEDKRKVLSFFLLRFFVSFLFSHRGHRKKRQRERDPLRSGPNKPIIKHNAVANIGFVVLSPRGVVVLFFLCFFWLAIGRSSMPHARKRIRKSKPWQSLAANGFINFTRHGSRMFIFGLPGFHYFSSFFFWLATGSVSCFVVVAVAVPRRH